MIQSVMLPIWLKTFPALSLHSTTVPVIEPLAVAMAVELNKTVSDSDVISVILWNVKGPQESVEIGGLWSINSLHSTGGLKIHHVFPVSSLPWLQVIEIWSPTQTVNVPGLSLS